MQNFFQCFKCGTQNRIGESACRKCGSIFKYACPSCKNPVAGDYPVCNNCGNVLTWGTETSSNPVGEGKLSSSSGNKKGLSWLLPAIGLLLIIIIIISCIYVYITLNEKPLIAVSSNNVSQGQEQEQAYIVPDSKPPHISNIEVNNLNDNSVSITWNTDEESTTQVIWNMENSNTNTTPQKEALVLQHSVELTGLKTNAVYYYIVSSIDKFNNQASSDKYFFKIGDNEEMVKIDVVMHTMSIEDQPSGTRTLVRGQIINNGDSAVITKYIEVLINVSVSGQTGTEEIIASIDPSPEILKPHDTQNFIGIVPNNSSPLYTIEVKVNNPY